jgi:hypothetical protein
MVSSSIWLEKKAMVGSKRFITGFEVEERGTEWTFNFPTSRAPSGHRMVFEILESWYHESKLRGQGLNLKSKI